MKLIKACNSLMGRNSKQKSLFIPYTFKKLFIDFTKMKVNTSKLLHL